MNVYFGLAMNTFCTFNGTPLFVFFNNLSTAQGWLDEFVSTVKTIGGTVA